MGNIEEFGLPGLPLILLGNKADPEGKREVVVIVISTMAIMMVLQVERERGEALAREHSMAFMETSARTGVNVAQVSLADCFSVSFVFVCQQINIRNANQLSRATNLGILAST